MSRRGWLLVRAGLLALAAVVLSPVSPLVLVGVPVAVLLLAFRPTDVRTLAIAAVILLAAFTGAGDGRTGLWYAERGWALLVGGGFVAATVFLGRRESLVLRGVAAVVAGLTGVGAVALLRPDFPAEVDGWISAELQRAAGAAYRLLGEAGADVGWAVFDWVEFQVNVFPALLGLATVASLAVGWYVLRRLDGHLDGLPPVREFRFNDHLVWVLVAGLAFLAAPWPGELWDRAGENALLFMGGMYLLRGAAVLVWIVGSAASSAWSAALWGLAALLLYPFAAVTALVLGLCDTWIDLRSRLARSR